MSRKKKHGKHHMEHVGLAKFVQMKPFSSASMMMMYPILSFTLEQGSMDQSQNWRKKEQVEALGWEQSRAEWHRVPSTALLFAAGYGN